MTSLSVDRISKRFSRRPLFSELSFSLEPGIILAITGENGSGKSTLLRIVAGVMEADSGAVSLIHNGRPVPDALRPLSSGFVAPYLNLYDALTARENLAFVASLRGLADKSARVSSLLDFVGLSQRADDFVGTFSTGMKHRMRFAAALMGDPPLLLLDEPSSNLDAAGRAMVERTITRQRDAGGLVVIATNDEQEAERCDRMVSIGDFQPRLRSA